MLGSCMAPACLGKKKTWAEAELWWEFLVDNGQHLFKMQVDVFYIPLTLSSECRSSFSKLSFMSCRQRWDFRSFCMIQSLILVNEHGINFPHPLLLNVFHIPQVCALSNFIYITILLLNDNSLSTTMLLIWVKIHQNFRTASYHRTFPSTIKFTADVYIYTLMYKELVHTAVFKILLHSLQ